MRNLKEIINDIRSICVGGLDCNDQAQLDLFNAVDELHIWYNLTGPKIKSATTSGVDQHGNPARKWIQYEAVMEALGVTEEGSGIIQGVPRVCSQPGNSYTGCTG